MIRGSSILCLAFVAAVLTTGCTLTLVAQSPAKDPSLLEGAVIESMATKTAFESDGNSTRVQTSRVRVQTDAGVKAWGILNFPYQSAMQIVEIDYVRVQKPDGSTVVTSNDDVQDLDSEITRSAPLYSDLREKHVPVKGLSKGDSLEFRAHWHTTKPPVAGQFWFEYNFQRQGIVLSELVEVRVPEARAVKVKGPQATQTVAKEPGYRIYSWSYSRLENTKEPENEQKKQTETAIGRLPAPDINISSFQTWDEVGRWYWSLQKDRVEPTAAVRAKAAELTKGMTDDDAKLRALYSFVSSHYRYIGIAFGTGRYQPHAAEDVLSNNYGDCKDKHTLLAALMQASGIQLYPALISSSQILDAEIPSPAQFDHVIGYLPQGKDKKAVWLDTTTEIAPFGFLVAALRDKQSLIISGDKSAQLVTTPADPLIPNNVIFQVDAKLGSDGTLEAKIEHTSQGDGEIILRSVFRQVPENNWKELVQQISYGLGFSGTVSDVSASQPDVVNGPFHFSYSYNRKDYPDWNSSQRFTVPGLPFSLPLLRDDASYPIWLGSPIDAVSSSKVETPPGQQSQLPSNVDLKYDFAEYHASYSHEGGALVAHRQLVTKQREIPVSKFDDYKKFLKKVDDDVNQYVLTASYSGLGTNNASAQAFLHFPREIQELPDSGIPEANRLESEARESMRRLDEEGALKSFRSAVTADPNFARAWVLLGALLLEQKQYSESATAFESAIKIKTDLPIAHASLGSAYLLAREREKALAAFAKLAEVDRNGETFNDVAYEMTKADLKLPLALDYANRAVRAAELETQTTTLEDLKVGDLARIFKLAAYWDTLGWAEARTSNLEQAERYLKASWMLTQDGVVGDHLCDVYERLHKVGLAIQICRLALNRMSMSHQLTLADAQAEINQTTKHLDHLLGGNAQGKNWDDVSDLIIRERTFKLPKFLPGTESAEFFVLFGSDGKNEKFKVEGVKFIGGSNKMKLQGKQLTSIDFNLHTPDDNPTRFVRRGFLGCYQYTGCSFVLLDPAGVTSLN